MNPRTMKGENRILVAIAAGCMTKKRVRTAGRLLGSRMPNSDYPGLLMMELVCQFVICVWCLS